MGLKLMDAVGKSGLPARLCPVALVYARKANDDGSNCKPGVDFVARYLKLKPRIIRRHRNELIELGVLKVETEWHGSRKVVRVTEFKADKLPPLGTTVPTMGTTVPTQQAPVALQCRPHGTTVPPTSISTSQEKNTRATAPGTSKH